GQAGVTADDEMVAKILHSAGKPVILAVNKVDSAKQESGIHEFWSLGLGEPVAISAANALNLGEMLDRIVDRLPVGSAEPAEVDDVIRVAVVGRPNVGKSSLVNRILGEERVIVSEVAGTTRDAIDTPFSRDGQSYLLIDTAGMRRRGRVGENTVERYGVIRALRAVERADVVLMVIDAVNGITEQDQKIAGFVHEAGRGVIIVFNKWDLVRKHDKTSLEFIRTARQRLPFMQYAPVVFISALTGQRVTRITGLINYVAEQHALRVATPLLNKVIEDAVSANPPPARKGKKLRILYVTQAKVRPPTFVLFVNSEELVHFSYVRFIENRLREAFGFEGTPVRFVVRNRRDKED
ncbi:MAG: ribosome biogenesis GTPase Der, partial [Negativicutes bacterium]|nr:ribosome biogenesis GTPase Der [Negativicutes bacterium]